MQASRNANSSTVASAPSRPTAGRCGEEVLYVHPAKQGVEPVSDRDGFGNPYLIFPMGVIALANLLRSAGHSVRGLNYPLEVALNSRFDLNAWLRTFSDVRFILIDLHWYEHAYGAIQAARICRNCHPQAWIILGGLTASSFAEEILADHAEIDFVIRGDAEMPLLDLLEAVGDLLHGDDVDFSHIPNLTYRRRAQVVSTVLDYCAGPRHLDSLNFVDLDWLEHANEYGARQFSGLRPLRGHWLCIGRGCWHDCSYCGGGQTAHRTIAGRQKVVVRSVDRVLRDIERLASRGIGQVAFNLDISELGHEYWHALLSGMRERELGIGVYNEFYNLPAADFVDELVRSVDLRASRLAFSPLSGSERVRRLNGKRYGNRDLMQSIGQLAQHNALLMVYFSLNLPGEGPETFRETLDLAQLIWKSYPPGAIDLLNMCHSLDPVSQMSRSPEGYGIAPELSTFQDYYEYCRRTRRGGQGARCGDHRGFRDPTRGRAALEEMADAWDAAGRRHGEGWHSIPTTW